MSLTSFAGRLNPDEPDKIGPEKIDWETEVPLENRRT
jgi:hypothetical protein